MRAKRNSERRRSYGYIQASGLTSPRPTEARGVPIALGAVDQGTHVETQYAHHHNARRLTVAATERASEAVRNLRDWAGAVDELRGWPEYAESPLRSLDHTARRLSVGKLYYKDESERFGRELASFKALGAPYAVFSLLADTVENQTGRRPIASQLRGDEFRAITEGVTVCVATDGNQGRGLAYAAKAFGCRCVIYIHGHVSPGRKDAVERFGAVVIRIDGEYEASVARAKDDAEINDWHFVSSTSWDEFRSPVPRSVMQGYMVLVEEALAQLPDAGRITHVFMQGGVGSIAAAVFLGFHQRLAPATPRLILVEPAEADCLFQSAVAGRPVPSGGSLRTIMAGLACREVSPAAWHVLEWLTSDFLTIPDTWAAEAMRALADGSGDTPVVCGESAAGGMAVMLKAADDADLRSRLGLTPQSHVVLFGLEGATDPAIYEEIVHASPDAVFARQRQGG
jgi:diaminopropionate ammonia-lyase